jgi:hypothetical protein
MALLMSLQVTASLAVKLPVHLFMKAAASWALLLVCRALADTQSDTMRTQSPHLWQSVRVSGAGALVAAGW